MEFNENSNGTQKDITINKNEKVILPDSFTIKLEGDLGSSGADRDYNATLVFKDGKLVSGEATFHVGTCTGKEYDYIASLENGKWIDKKTNDVCEIDFNDYNPITKEELENDINSDKIKSIENQGHGDISYELVK